MNRLVERAAVLAIRGGARLLRGSFTAGSVCRIRDGQARVLLVKPRYRADWGLPGGFLGRGEQPQDAIRRELGEELGLDLDPGEAVIHFVHAHQRHIEFVFAARLDDAQQARVTRTSPELARIGWHSADALPPLQPEAAEALARLARLEAP